jgi:type 1 glutamine amidotransferase
MRRQRTTSFVAAVFAAAFGGALGTAQQPAPGAAPAPQGGGGRGGGAAAAGFFTAVDANKDGSTTRDEMRSTFERWFTEWDTAKTGTLGQEQIAAGLTAAMPAPAAPAGGFGGGRGAQNQTPQPQHVDAMVAALPATAPAKPKQARKVLVLGKAAGFVHSSIPLAGRTVDELGKKTGAWTTTITYDPADINEQNLKQYDGIFLASTTGAFLDDANDAAATAARRKALLDFVRGGKGLIGIHAATDSYHQNAPAAAPAAPAAGAAAPGGAAPGGAAGRAGRGGFGGGRGGAAPLAAAFVAQGDKNSDQRLSKEEFVGLADAWYGKLDTANAGRVSQAEFSQRYVGAVLPPPPPAAAASTFAPPRPGCTGYSNQQASTQLGPDNQVGTWPEFNKMIGGFFKWHWNNPQEITYKIDEPNHPLNAPFKKLSGPLVINDETYTMGRDTYSRQNVRVLTSVDYSKMCDEDKKKELNPREDHDYALSWIKRDGKGRVFYMTHGHDESVYAKTPLLEHLLAGMQYALGDLQADDSPSVKGGTK